MGHGYQSTSQQRRASLSVSDRKRRRRAAVRLLLRPLSRELGLENQLQGLLLEHLVPGREEVCAVGVLPGSWVERTCCFRQEMPESPLACQVVFSSLLEGVPPFLSRRVVTLVPTIPSPPRGSFSNANCPFSFPSPRISRSRIASVVPRRPA